MDDSVISEALVPEFQQVEVDYQHSDQFENDAMEIDYSAGAVMDSAEDSDSDGVPADLPDLVYEDEEAEEKRVLEFMTKTCSCHFGPKSTACSSLFDRELIATTRMNCREMTKAQLDLVILANLEAHQHYQSQELSRKSIDYYFHGHKVCKTTFLFVHSVGSKHFNNLVAHFNHAGLSLRMHGNVKCLPANTIPFSTTEHVVQFILNFATVHALPLPGRLPGQFSDEKALLLPSDMLKRYVYRKYCAALPTEEKPISRRKFESLWCQLVPHISLMKPKTDLCETCHLNITRVLRSANLAESVKSDQLKNAQHHLDLAKQERMFYNEECLKAMEELKNNPSSPKFTHLSFDFAQQLHYPNSPQQVGALYFLTPHKCQLFGVCCEAKSEQVNYLIDENDNPGKGANCVVSMVHHYLETHCPYGQEVLLHADNAVGLNKNNVFMQYLCWRVITGKNMKAKISFMIPGHTKFAPDRFFGLLKKMYRKTNVSSLGQVESVVCNSTVSGKNIPLTTVDPSGKLNVWHNWSDYFNPHFTTIPSISKYHHFQFDSISPGVAFVKEHSAAPETTVTIISNCEFSSVMPKIIVPNGMSMEQLVYLYEKIRPFCSSDTADLTCPHPPISANPIVVKSKSQRKCSHCRQIGHTKTVRGVITCPQLLNQ